MTPPPEKTLTSGPLTRPSRPAAAPLVPPGDSRFLTPEELRAELEAAGPLPLPADEAGPADNSSKNRPGRPDDTAAPAEPEPSGAAWGLEFERDGLARTAARFQEAALKAMWVMLIGAFFLFMGSSDRLTWWVQATALAVSLGLVLVVLVGAHFEGRPFDLVPSRRIRLIFAPGRLIWRSSARWGDEMKIFPLEDITGLFHLHPYSREPEETLLGLSWRSGEAEFRHKLLYDRGRPGTCLRVGELIQEALFPRTVPVRQSPPGRTDARGNKPDTWTTLFPLDEGQGPPRSAPPGVKILAAEKLGSVPALADLAPADRSRAWGLEFDQRHFGLALLNIVFLPVFLTPLVGAAWFYTHDGAELISWGHMLASLLPIAFFAFCSYGIAMSADRFLTRRVRLIFPPSGFIWQERSILGRREVVFGPDQIDRLIHSRPQGGSYDDRHLCAFYRPDAGEQADSNPAGPDPDDGRASSPGREIFVDLLYDRGRRGNCAWAAALIIRTLTPGTFTFEDRPIVERTPEEIRNNMYGDN